MKPRLLWLLVLPFAAGCGQQAFPYEQLSRPAKAAYPAPPPGAVVFARQAGDDALALAVGSRRGRTLTQVSVVGMQGRGATGLQVRVRASGSWQRAGACGPGCYRTSFAGAPPRAVDVEVRGRSRPTVWHVALPERSPAPPAGRILRRADRVWRSLRSVVVHDRLATDARHAVDTTWSIVAPDRVAYRVAGGGQAVIIGPRRWDGGPRRWTASVQDPPVRQPVPFWVAVANAHVVGTRAVGDATAWRVTFFDPKTPGWFEALIDRRTLRTLDLRMVAAAHFMHDRYSGFDAPLRIRPPVSG